MRPNSATTRRGHRRRWIGYEYSIAKYHVLFIRYLTAHSTKGHRQESETGWSRKWCLQNANTNVNTGLCSWQAILQRSRTPLVNVTDAIDLIQCQFIMTCRIPLRWCAGVTKQNDIMHSLRKYLNTPIRRYITDCLDFNTMLRRT